MPFFFLKKNVVNYYFKHKGNICSRQPARQQTEPTGWSAHQPGQRGYNSDGVMTYSYCSHTSLLSSLFLKISYTDQIGYGSTVTSIYSTCSLSRPLGLSYLLRFASEPSPPPRLHHDHPHCREGMNRLSSAKGTAFASCIIHTEKHRLWGVCMCNCRNTTVATTPSKRDT